MSTRLRIVLPSVIGIVSLPLVIWDIHNARVIESMGMAWDMGAPIWPYQASDILLRLLDGPAYAIVMPIANLLRLAAPTHLVLVVPAFFIWWWFLGLTLDRGLARWALFGMLVVLVALLLWSAVAVRSVFLIRLDYRHFDLFKVLLILRFLTPAVWSIALTSLLVARAKRVVSPLT
jgi:hypothetical protein